MMCSTTLSQRSEWMSGPVETPSCILASLSRKNFCRRYRNSVPLWSIAFTKFFMRPNLTWKKSSITQTVKDALHFCVLAPNFFWQAVSFWHSVCLVPAVPLTQETRKFSVPTLHSSKSAMTMFHLYVSYFMYCSNCFMLSSLSIIPNACATGMESNTYPSCRRTRTDFGGIYE